MKHPSPLSRAACTRSPLSLSIIIIAATITILLCTLPSHALDETAKPLKGPAWAELEEKEIPMPHAPFAVCRIVRPKAITTLPGLQKFNPDLPKLLPDLPALLLTAKVSAKFETLYDAKAYQVARGARLSEGDYFDCATLLDLRKNDQRAILWQSNMDVDTDGSDPTRLKTRPEYGDSPDDIWFQPLLSYKWNKKSAVENPFLPDYKARVVALKKILDAFASSPILQKQMKQEVKKIANTLEQYREDCDELPYKSSPVSALDPFIVIPRSWTDVRPGTCAAVIVNQRIYPCMVGDKGPIFKTGEASLKIAREANSKASGIQAALDTLGATYLVFPGESVTAPPDYQLLSEKVHVLMIKFFGPIDDTNFRRW